MTGNPLLRIANLNVAYHQRGEWLDVLREVSLQVAAGQTYGLVGESGSGKSTLMLAVIGYLDANGRVNSGEISFKDIDVLSLDKIAVRAVWRDQVALVPQNPGTSLNPSLRIGDQIRESIALKLGLKQKAARESTLEWLGAVGLPDPQRNYSAYPHQISGGMQQRVLIAMAMSAQPDLLLLDEPTTNLDATSQASILDLLGELMRGSEISALYATHNMGVVAQMCDRVAVLYAGELVEDLSIGDLFNSPLHPYTRGLLDSLPVLGAHRSSRPIHAIPGSLPRPGQLPGGCAFEPRCPLAVSECRSRPPLTSAGPDHRVRCWRWEDIASGQIRAVFPAAETSWGAERVTPGQDVLKIDGVSVFFSQQQTLGEGLRRTPATRIRAVDDFSLNIRQATTVGLVGESGSGKTTLARCIVGLQERNAGEMTLVHAPLPPRLAERDIDTLRHLQLVFQNPEHALNPYQSVGEILSLPLQVLQGLPRDRVRHEVERLLEMVHLAGYAARKPSQLSGGEVQRIALARAFAANPALLVADEPVSSLDVSVQAAVLNLLNELQLQHGSALLFISHDIAVVGYLSDQIAVMFAGKLLQFSSQHEFFEPPHHPYTEDLLACIPIHPPGSRPKPPLLDSSDPPVSGGVRGCPYYKRCQYRIEGTCDRIDPPWQVTEGGGRIYCHVSPVELHSAQVEHPAHNMNRERSDP